MATPSPFTLLDTSHDPKFQISKSSQFQSLALFFPTHLFAVLSSSLTLNTIYIRTTHKHILPVPTLPLNPKLLHLAAYEVFLFDCALDISSLTYPIVNVDSTIQSIPIILTFLHLVLHISSLSKPWICCLQNLSQHFRHLHNLCPHLCFPAVSSYFFHMYSQFLAVTSEQPDKSFPNINKIITFPCTKLLSDLSTT